MIPARTFESLFRALQPHGTFRDELLALGIDPEHLAATYSAETWRGALEVARRHAFGTLEDDAAYHAIGTAAVDGFVHTLVGRVYGVMLPLLGAERVLAMFPYYVSLVRPDATTHMSAEGHGRWRAQMHVPLAFPSFNAGVLARALHLAGKREAVVRVENEAPDDHFDLVAQW